MQNKIKNLKYRINKNHSKLIEKYGEKCELAVPIINMIDILLKVDASDETINTYLNDIDSSLIIIEEKIKSVENMQSYK